MELYSTRGGFSAKWDIKLSCLLGRPCVVTVPYASCVIFQLFPLFVAAAVVLLSCYIKFSRDAVGFFSFWIFPPSHCAKGPYGTAITSGPAGNSHSGSIPEQGCMSKKKMKEGGRGEGGRDYFQEQKSQNIQGLCSETGNSPSPPWALLLSATACSLLDVGTVCHQGQLAAHSALASGCDSEQPPSSGCHLEGLWKGYMWS